MSVAGNPLPLDEIVRADLIHTTDVIGMGMSEEDRVNAIDLGTNRLLSQIDRGVDEQTGAVDLDPDGRPESLILRITGSTDFAITMDQGDSGRGTTPQNLAAHFLEGHDIRNL